LAEQEKYAVNGNLLIIFGVTLLAVMGVANITPAFPKIMAQFSLTGGQVGLLITTFTLPSVLLTPVLGVAADRFGRKRILAISLLLFGVAGGLCGLARDFDTLLLLRVFQGAGAASLSSLNTTIIGDLYHGTRRASIMGINASVLSIGTAAYPLIGGALAIFAWNYPFFMSLAAIPLGLVVLKFLKNPEPTRNQNLKEYFAGAWKGIKNSKVLSIFVVGILTFIILFGCLSTALSILLGQNFGASSLVIGVIMFTMSITTAAVSSQLGRICGRFSKENLLRFAFSCYIVAMVLIAFNSSIWLFIIPMLVFGLGHGLTVPILQTLLADQAPVAYRAVFMSLNGAMLRTGQSLGPLLIGLAFALPNYRWAFFIGGLLAIIAIIVVTFGIKNRDSDAASRLNQREN
jgi:ACDE family multidrug resistance protein